MEYRTVEHPMEVTDKIALIIATGFGLGYSPIAPGTVGSFLGIILILLISKFRLIGGQRLLFHLVMITMISVVGIWAASRAEIVFKRKDPPQVVIDEVVGQLLTFGLIFRNPTFSLLLMGFLFFRLFDIIKPFPIRKLEKVPLGFGVVLDDLAAGLYASLFVFVVQISWPALA